MNASGTQREYSGTSEAIVSLPFDKQNECIIPFDWVLSPLREVAPLQRGFDLPTSQIRSGPYPVVYSNGVLEYHNQSMVKSPGVVTGRSGTIGKVHFIEKDYWPHNTSLWVTSFRGNDPKFIYYLYTHIDLARLLSGSGVPTLNRNDVHQHLVAYPPLAEQRAIAEALSDVDGLLAALEALITKKRAIKQATMQQLLTGKTRLPGFSEGEDWGALELQELCTHIVDGTHFTPKYVPDGIPFYSVENVTADDFTDVKYISESEHNLLIRRCNPQRGDILLTRIGSLGDTKLIDWDVNASIYVSLALLKLGKCADPEYIYHYTKSFQFTWEVESRSLVNAIPKKINMGDIGAIPIRVPPTESEQRAIATILSDMDAEIAALERRRDKTHAVKQGMMQQLLTGRVRLIESEMTQVNASGK